MALFTYMPDRNIKRTNTPTVLMSQFGDGYSQRTTTLLNNVNSSWNLSFKNRLDSEINNIVSFFESTNGVDSFTWQPPGEDSVLTVIVKKWDKVYVNEGISSLTATLERVYE